MKFSFEQINNILNERIKTSKEYIPFIQERVKECKKSPIMDLKTIAHIEKRIEEIKYKIEELEDLKIIFTRINEEEKISFQQLTINEIKSENVLKYMNKHEGIKETLDSILKSVCELLPSEEKILEIFYDPEIEDSWISITAFLKDNNLEKRQEIEDKIEEIYLPFLQRCPSGWITFQTETKT